MNSFDRDFDDLFAECLLSWQNAFPGVDSSQGSLIYHRAANLAVARWGIHKAQSWVYDQDDPQSAARASLERLALRYGLALIPGESDSALLDRVHDRLRNPPAGGNEHDYIRWAKEVEDVAGAKMYENEQAQGLGTVDVVTWGPEGDDFVPDLDKRTEVYNYIMARRSVGLYLLRVLSIALAPTNVTMTGVGATLAAQVAADITSYLDSLQEGQTLYINQILSIATQNGAPAAVLVTPVADVVPDLVSHEILRPGTINVT